MPLENNMKTPSHFIGCPGVLNTGMFCVVLLYSTVGFFGYWKYGESTKASITLNPPQDEVLAQSAKVMIAIAIFLTYGLQFYVPMEIIWKNAKQYFGSRRLLGEYFLRILLVIFTVCVAIAIPNLGPFISLVGAVCLSTLGLMFPSVIELVTVWEQENGLGKWNWRLWKNIAIISFGVLGFLTGTYVSIQEILEGKWGAGSGARSGQRGSLANTARRPALVGRRVPRMTACWTSFARMTWCCQQTGHRVQDGVPPESLSPRPSCPDSTTIVTIMTTTRTNDEDIRGSLRVIEFSFIIFLTVVKLVLRASCTVDEARSVYGRSGKFEKWLHISRALDNLSLFSRKNYAKSALLVAR